MKTSKFVLAILFATSLLTLVSCSKEADLIKSEHASKATLDSAWVNHVNPGEIWEIDFSITYRWAGDTITETLISGRSSEIMKLAASQMPEPNLVIGRYIKFTENNNQLGNVICNFSSDQNNRCSGIVPNGKWKGNPFGLNNLVMLNENEIVATDSSYAGICHGPQSSHEIFKINFSCKRITEASH